MVIFNQTVGIMSERQRFKKKQEKVGEVGPAGKPTQSKRTLTKSHPFLSIASFLWYSKITELSSWFIQNET